MIVRSGLARLKHRVIERRLPKVFVLKDLDPWGVRFEATNLVERNRIISYGYEPEYLGAMVDALRADDVLYDVGANVGLVTLHAARKCRTVAFEPDPDFLARLHRNIQLNPDVTVEVVPVAISDEDGTATLYTDGVRGRSPSLVHQRGENNAVSVTTQMLDTLVTSGSLPLPTAIKLDIEGAEMLALRGATNLLNARTAPRALFLEVHNAYLQGFGSSADEVLTFVRSAGYTTVRYEASRFAQQHLILERS